MKINDCKSGDIVAKDIINIHGIPLVVRSTILNEYIIDKLINLGIQELSIYQKEEVLVSSVNTYYDNTVKNSYFKSFIAIKQFINGLSLNHDIEFDVLKDISKEIYNCIGSITGIIHCLSEIRNADEYTYYHSLNVAFYSMLLAKWLNYSEEKTQDVIMAGLLHDIGKILISNDILNKKGKLTNDEYEEMNNHTIYGFDKIKNISDLNEEIIDAVRHHHERFDGSGYPDKLTGDNLGELAKIIAIVDVYDAMTQNRVYKGKVTPFDSFNMFLTVGITNFDPKILFTFLRNLSVYYVGMKVQLNTGKIGTIVYVPPQDVVSPIIKINSKYIDLSNEKDIKIVSFEL
jgi:putative nucleotidyltransferase with HDIG domain